MADKKSPTKSEEYKLVGAHPQDLASGQMLAVGETADISSDDADTVHNKTLIDDGVLISTAATSQQKEGGEES